MFGQFARALPAAGAGRAMGRWREGNAKSMGVSLRHLLDLAGVHAGAVAVRVGAMDKPLVRGARDFDQSLGSDHARDGEVMLAFATNSEQLPLLNSFPVRAGGAGLVFDLLDEDGGYDRGAARARA